MPENESPKPAAVPESHTNIEPYCRAPKDSPENNTALILIMGNGMSDMLRLTPVLPAAGRADVLAQIAKLRELAKQIPITEA